MFVCLFDWLIVCLFVALLFFAVCVVRCCLLLVVSVWLFVVCSCSVLVLSYRVLLLRMLLQLLFRSPSSLLNSILLVVALPFLC